MAASATVLPGEAIAALVEASQLKEAIARVVVIDGAVASQLSDTERLPQEVRIDRYPKESHICLVIAMERFHAHLLVVHHCL